MANLDHCLDLVREWHSMRSDLEIMLFSSNKETLENLFKGTHGSYKCDVFQGHCENDGDDFYIPLGGNATWGWVCDRRRAVSQFLAWTA